MKLHEIKNLKETMKSETIPQHVINATFEYLEAHGIHTGDQDGKKIYVCDYNDLFIYGIMNDGILTSFLSISKDKDVNGFNKLFVMFTKPEFRGKNDLQRLFWFLKDDEGLKIISGGVQSDAGHALMKSLERSKRFSMFWYNLDTKEKLAYSGEDDMYPSKFRGAMITPWRIIIEAANSPVFESRFTGLKRAFYIFED